MNFDIYIIAGVILVICLLVFWIIHLETKLRKLLGEKSGSLDEIIDTMRKEVSYLKRYSENNTEKLNVIDKKLKKTISGHETVRFNPFKGTGSGSNQSFATAFINADGDGVVISSLYAREHVSIYSKPIKNLESEYELTTEEKTAIQRAQESIIQ
jgi:hypothetical protein